MDLFVVMQDFSMLMPFLASIKHVFLVYLAGVAKMRNQYRQKENGNKYNVTDDQISQLESVGFQWRVGKGKSSRNWDEFFKDLLNFRQEHG